MLNPRAILVLLLLAVPASSSAAPAGEPLPIIDLLSSSADREALSSTWPDLAHGESTLVAPDTALVSALRLASPDPARASCDALTAPVPVGGEPTDPPAPRSGPPPDGLVSAHLQQADDHLLALELEPALAALARARAWFPCAESTVRFEDVRRLFLLEAVVRFHLEKAAYQDAFADLAAVDGRDELEKLFNPAVREAFRKEAQRRNHGQRRILQVGGMPGRVYVDGRAVEGALEVWPGVHLVQLGGPFGGVRARWVYIPAAQPAEPATLSLEAAGDFHLQTAEDALNALALALVARQLKPYQEWVLDRHVRATGRSAIEFAVASAGGGLERVRYEPGLGVTPVPVMQLETASVTDPPPVAAPAKPPWWRQLEPSLGVSAHALVGWNVTDIGSSRGAGYTLRLEHPVARLHVGLELSLYPHVLFGPSEAECDQASSGDASDQGAACLPPETAMSAGAGVGLVVPLWRDLFLLPMVYLEGAYVPQVVLSDVGQAGDLLVYKSLQLGLMARLRLCYGIRRVWGRLDPCLELAAGGVGALVSRQLLATFPVGGSALIGVSF